MLHPQPRDKESELHTSQNKLSTVKDLSLLHVSGFTNQKKKMEQTNKLNPSSFVRHLGI